MEEQLKKVEVSCEVCLETFSQKAGHIPRIISCGHTFCESCLEKLEKRKHLMLEICCPKCKMKSVFAKPVKMLPKNFSYLNLIEELQEIQKNKAQSLVNYCKKHPNYVLDMFCHEDGKPICLRCAVYGNHKHHISSSLSVVAKKRKRAIEGKLTSLADEIVVLGEKAEAMSARKSLLVNNYNKNRKDILDLFSSTQEQIEGVFDVKLNTVLTDLDKMHTFQLDLIKENLEVAFSTEELEGLESEMGKFLSEATEFDLAKKKYLIKEIKSEVKEVENRLAKTKHLYEIKIDDPSPVIEKVSDLANNWVCKVSETAAVSTGKINDINLDENPFDDIGCEKLLYSQDKRKRSHSEEILYGEFENLVTLPQPGF